MFAQAHRRGLRFEFVLDEGMTILDGVLKDFMQPIAMIGVLEKVCYCVQGLDHVVSDDACLSSGRGLWA